MYRKGGRKICIGVTLCPDVVPSSVAESFQGSESSTDESSTAWSGGGGGVAEPDGGPDGSSAPEDDPHLLSAGVLGLLEDQESLLGASSRLQRALERMLVAIAESSDQEEEEEEQEQEEEEEEEEQEQEEEEEEEQEQEEEESWGERTRTDPTMRRSPDAARGRRPFSSAAARVVPLLLRRGVHVPTST
ncbi:hypothetical protein N1851_027411 [Merluccius polli]|uniref:Uncharacterized protein n=1 Tax=Merluccius polli TaxID=89951 RepID=A0AA47MAA5_MERPO|nr:hypothetical protein N1851_027411 [Merluccius polli]